MNTFQNEVSVKNFRGFKVLGILYQSNVPFLVNMAQIWKSILQD